MIRALFIDEATKSLETKPGQQIEMLQAAGMRLAGSMSRITSEGPLSQETVRDFAVAGSLAVAELSKSVRPRGGRSSVELVTDDVNARVKLYADEAAKTGANNNLSPTAASLVGGMKVLSALPQATAASSLEDKREALLNIAAASARVLSTHQHILEDMVSVTRHDVTSPLHGARPTYALQPVSSPPTARSAPLAMQTIRLQAGKMQ
jgi:hypothetical protein